MITKVGYTKKATTKQIVNRLKKNNINLIITEKEKFENDKN